VGPVAGDAVNPSMGAWPRHPCRGHPRNRPHPAFDRFLPLLVGADLSRHGVGSRCHATGSDPDLRSIGSEPFPVGKRIRPRASQAPVATGRQLSLTHPLHELVGADRWSARSRSHGDATDSGPDLRSMGSEPFSVGKRIRPRASQAPVATGRLLSLTQRSTNWWVPTLVGTRSDPVATQRALTPIYARWGQSRFPLENGSDPALLRRRSPPGGCCRSPNAPRIGGCRPWSARGRIPLPRNGL